TDSWNGLRDEERQTQSQPEPKNRGRLVAIPVGLSPQNVDSGRATPHSRAGQSSRFENRLIGHGGMQIDWSGLSLNWWKKRSLFPLTEFCSTRRACIPGNRSAKCGHSPITVHERNMEISNVS